MEENEEVIKNFEDRRDLIFFHICLVWRMENGEMKNEVDINLHFCPIK